MSEDDDKPFGCSEPQCGMRFTNEDHLNVHMKKHEMNLALNLGGSSASPSHHFLDQTPTPTKFLKNCEEIGLFQELSKNPFEEAFKKATDSDVPPLPGPLSNDLNTPIPKHLDLHTPTPRLDLLHHRLLKETSLSSLVYHQSTCDDEVLDLSASKKMPSKQTSFQPSSTTDEEVILITTSQAADSTLSPSKIITSPITDKSTVTNTIPKLGTAVISSPMIIQTSPQLVSGSTTTSLPSNTVQNSNLSAAQVYLQLPTGQMVPVQIPVPTSVSPVVQIPLIPQTTTPAQPSSGTTTIAARPPSTTSNTTHITLKQRLKQSLQASQQQNKTNGLVTSNHNSISPVNVVSSSPNTIIIPDSINSATTAIIIPETVSQSEFTPPDSPDSYYTDIKRARNDEPQQSFDDEDPDNRRRKFLERNRAAAARCRQKRKTWVNSLEKKADDLQNVNVKLQSEVSLLRREVAQLKTLLLAHKECPVTLQQKSQGQIPLSLTVPTTNGDEISTTGVIQHITFNGTGEEGATLIFPTSTNILTPIKSEPGNS